MLDRTCLYQESKELARNKNVILPLRVTWTDRGTDTVRDDGSFTDKADTTSTILAAIEPINSRSQKQHKAFHALAEETTHVMFTLRTYDISEQDIITYNGKVYRVIYVFPEQYHIQFKECLLKVET